MKIIDGKGMVLGRLASYAAKEALKGEEVRVLNSEQIIITGSRTSIEKDFLEQRSRVGSSQKGPKHSVSTEKIVKRVIRGMIPDHRGGRGKIALKRVKCYVGEPAEFKDLKRTELKHENRNKFITVKEISK